MHPNSFVTTIWLCVILVWTTACSVDQTNVADLEEQGAELIGNWRLLGSEDKPLPDHLFLVWTFDQSTLKVTTPGGELFSSSSYQIDTSFEPAHLDVEIRDLVEEDRLGIYKIENGKLYISQTISEGDRPDNFGGDTLVFQRMDAPFEYD